MPQPHRQLSLLALWNMSFGFMGIQFGFGLQMSNMSAIYQYLGARESDIPLLWLAAPMTGLIVQPIIGHYSDRTWTRLGRRRPYFLGGALAASAALIAMPNASSLWVAAGLLWVLDASVNISMEPFRAFIGDLVPPQQRKVGYAMQSLLIGLGAVLSSALPWLLTHFGLVGAAKPGSRIPPSVHLAFDIGAAVYLACVLYTILTTPEKPPERMPGRGGRSALHEIFAGLRQMPLTMRRLAWVQFFTWLGLFCMWLYFTPVVAERFFGSVGTPAYTRGVEWSGVCFSVYNGVAALVSVGLVALARRGIGSRTLYRIGLVCAGAGLLLVAVWTDPHYLILTMVGVGIGWAAILSMPYALLANAIPAERMGFYMGVFNLFIVVPQIIAATVLGSVVQHLLAGRAFPMVLIGGGCFLLAAIALTWVPDGAPAPAEEEAVLPLKTEVP